MKTSTFLGTAGARIDNLRELSQDLRSLDLTTASLHDVENEIPDLELAMAVYRRLNAEGADPADTSDPQAFLSIAEGRTDHLRQLSNHMHSLKLVHTSLTDVENEIPELEVALSVYRRLTGETDGGSRSSSKPAPAWAKVAGNNALSPEDDANAAPVPSFSEFTIQHLDPADPPTAETAADPNGSR